MTQRMQSIAACIAVMLLLPVVVQAQDADRTVPGAATANPQPPPGGDAESATPGEPIATPPVPEGAVAQRARVVEVEGDVTEAPVGTSPLDGSAWTPIAVDDELSAGTQIRTGLKSSAILWFGDDPDNATVVMVKPLTLASLSECYRTDKQQDIHLGLGYGAIRGGSTEGTLRSNLIIDSTVATLAKRGTEGLEMQVEPYTGRFTILLAQEGLVDALQKATGERQRLRPGEYANEVNISRLWIRQERFDRNVRFYEAESVSSTELAFSDNSSRGLGVLTPGGGTEATQFAERTERGFVAQQVLEAQAEAEGSVDGSIPGVTPPIVVVELPAVRRAEGNFGVRRTAGTGNTFRVLVPEERASKYRRIGTRGDRRTPIRVERDRGQSR